MVELKFVILQVLRLPTLPASYTYRVFFGSTEQDLNFCFFLSFPSAVLPPNTLRKPEPNIIQVFKVAYYSESDKRILET